MKKSPIFPILIAIAIVSALISSCATAIPVTLQKPAMMNMVGVTRVVVSPIGREYDGSPSDKLQAAVSRLSDNYSRLSREDRLVAERLTQRLSESFASTSTIKVLGANELLLGMASGKPMGDIVDAFVNGEILMYTTQNKDGYEEVKASNGIITRVHWINREVSLQFTYRVVRAKDGVVLGEMFKTGTASDKQSGPDAFYRLRSPESLADSIIASTLADISREIAPYVSKEYRVLEKDSSKDARMAEADSLVKKGMYKDALVIFQSVYASSRNFAAGYNAAVMLEVLGDLPGAIVAMDSLYKATGNPKAQKELARMQASKADADKLKASTK